MKQLLTWNYVDENKFGLNLSPNNQKFKSQLWIINMYFSFRDDITNVTEHEIHSRFFDLFPGQTYWHTFETALTGSQSKLFETEIKNLQAMYKSDKSIVCRRSESISQNLTCTLMSGSCHLDRALRI